MALCSGDAAEILNSWRLFNVLLFILNPVYYLDLAGLDQRKLSGNTGTVVADPRNESTGGRFVMHTYYLGSVFRMSRDIDGAGQDPDVSGSI